MGLRLKIEGSESVNLPETSIERVKFGADIPHDSNARSTDLGSSILITGKILASVNGEAADDTSKLARWSLIPPTTSTTGITTMSIFFKVHGFFGDWYTFLTKVTAIV